MRELRFEWDPGKAAGNLRNHRIAFEVAEAIFSDEFAILLDDPDHSTDEDRFLLPGVSTRLRTLVVAHCYRRAEDVVRIISARKATRAERNIYNRRWQT